MVCCSIDITTDPSSIRDICCLELKKAPRFYSDRPCRPLRSLSAMLVPQCRMDSLFRRIRSTDIDHYRCGCGPRGARARTDSGRCRSIEFGGKDYPFCIEELT